MSVGAFLGSTALPVVTYKTVCAEKDVSVEEAKRGLLEEVEGGTKGWKSVWTVVLREKGGKKPVENLDNVGRREMVRLAHAGSAEEALAHSESEKWEPVAAEIYALYRDSDTLEKEGGIVLFQEDRKREFTQLLDPPTCMNSLRSNKFSGVVSMAVKRMDLETKTLEQVVSRPAQLESKFTKKVQAFHPSQKLDADGEEQNAEPKSSQDTPSKNLAKEDSNKESEKETEESKKTEPAKRPPIRSGPKKPQSVSSFFTKVTPKKDGSAGTKSSEQAHRATTFTQSKVKETPDTEATSTPTEQNDSATPTKSQDASGKVIPTMSKTKIDDGDSEPRRTQSSKTRRLVISDDEDSGDEEFANDISIFEEQQRQIEEEEAEKEEKLKQETAAKTSKATRQIDQSEEEEFVKDQKKDKNDSTEANDSPKPGNKRRKKSDKKDGQNSERSLDKKESLPKKPRATKPIQPEVSKKAESAPISLKKNIVQTVESGFVRSRLVSVREDVPPTKSEKGTSKEQHERSTSSKSEEKEQSSRRKRDKDEDGGSTRVGHGDSRKSALVEGKSSAKGRASETDAPVKKQKTSSGQQGILSFFQKK